MHSWRIAFSIREPLAREDLLVEHAQHRPLEGVARKSDLSADPLRA